MVTESPRVILGLRNFGIFHVFSAFALTMLVTDCFPLALTAAVLCFQFIRRQIDAKPRHHLRHWIEYTFLLPKQYRHRFRQ